MHTEPGALGQKWKKWLEHFKKLLIALDITASKQKKALLLRFAGSDVQEAYDTLLEPETAAAAAPAAGQERAHSLHQSQTMH